MRCKRGYPGTQSTRLFHFLLLSVETCPADSEGNCVLPINDIYQDCKRLSFALSSLLVGVKKDQRGIMKAHDQYSINPELAHFDEPSVRMDSVAGGWRETVLRLYNDSQPRPDLHPDCLAWLDKKCEVGEPIDLLHKRELLSDRVLDAAVCSIMLSFASIQFLINQKLRGEPNLFVRALFLCAQRLEEFVDFSKSQILNALEFYIRSGSNLEETDQCFQARP